MRPKLFVVFLAVVLAAVNASLADQEQGIKLAVFEKDTEGAISGAAVSFTCAQDRIEHVRRSTEDSGEAVFTFGELPAGLYTMRVESLGYNTAELEIYINNCGLTIFNVPISLKPRARHEHPSEESLQSLTPSEEFKQAIIRETGQSDPLTGSFVYYVNPEEPDAVAAKTAGAGTEYARIIPTREEFLKALRFVDSVSKPHGWWLGFNREELERAVDVCERWTGSKSATGQSLRASPGWHFIFDRKLLRKDYKRWKAWKPPESEKQHHPKKILCPRANLAGFLLGREYNWVH